MVVVVGNCELPDNYVLYLHHVHVRVHMLAPPHAAVVSAPFRQIPHAMYIPMPRSLKSSPVPFEPQDVTQTTIWAREKFV